MFALFEAVVTPERLLYVVRYCCSTTVLGSSLGHPLKESALLLSSKVEAEGTGAVAAACLGLVTHYAAQGEGRQPPCSAAASAAAPR